MKKIIILSIVIFACFYATQRIPNSILTKKQLVKYHNCNLQTCKKCVCYRSELSDYIKMFKTTKITKKNCDKLLKITSTRCIRNLID